MKSRKVSSLFSGDLEKEPSVDRTLSLIDAFLATVPEEHSQHTELDYAVDYTAYLMQEEPVWMQKMSRKCLNCAGMN